MNAIHLMAVGAESDPAGTPLEALDELSAALAREFGVSCRVHTQVHDATYARDLTRGQYHSTAILQGLALLKPPSDSRLLGVTPLDLYVPVLTFVFGEAQLGGPCALVSTHRLAEEFYGLPADPARAAERLRKEALHELGHTRGLRHCRDWRCVMASAHSVERLDIKEARFCAYCRRVIE